MNDQFQGDLTFFTNSKNDSLKERFIRVLNSNTQFFDILVGYFRTSGFNELYESIEKVEKTRILVGINIDNQTFRSISKASDILLQKNVDAQEILENFSSAVLNEYNDVNDTKEVSESVNSFIKLLVEKKIEIRVYPHAPLHAKVYIMRKDREKVFDSYGSVITGSSNFSQSGLVNNLEFNVELKDARDVAYALSRFEELWEQGIDVSEEYVNTIKNKSWINEKRYTPRMLYYKFLADYFEAELDESEIEYYLPEGFKTLKYQEDAIRRAKEILNAYNGVFISDVVGLGKTYICSMLAQILDPGKKLFLCPPVLVDYWKQVLLQFNVPATVESIGKLDSLLDGNYDQYKYVFIDEAHRFRNQNTESYQKLHQLCINKKVILITATPLNNKIEDLANLIYLFQPKNNSNIIPNTKNLEKYFNTIKKLMKEYEETDNNKGILQIRKEVQDQILRNIMVRRTRGEIQKYYQRDLEAQGIKFPSVDDPNKITYMLDEKLDNIFNLTISYIKQLNYSRYKPLLYLQNQKELNLSTLTIGQHNMGGFMKALLVKRLESSFYAFKQTIKRFVQSYEYAIKMLNDNAFYIGEKVNVYELFSNDKEDKIIEMLDEGRLRVFTKKDFKKDFEKDLLEDLKILRKIDELWLDVTDDPKLSTLVTALKEIQSKNKKVIIFSESAETVEYLDMSLKDYNFECLSFDGSDSSSIRNTIELNFNPNIEPKKQEDNYNILITTDVLSEGINLHRSNIIINYDLPWNPTKIMQRVGRVNRIGTIHNKIHIYNFFPTDQYHAHLSLEENILNKIQTFHDLLGEDYKYLSEEENVSSHGIFSKNLLKDINNIINEDDEEIEDSELKYLLKIREIKENDKKLYKEIKNMPYKIRCAVDSENEFVLTYFRRGSLKKIFYSNTDEVKETTFINAATILEEYINSNSRKLSKNFFELLDKNINEFKAVLEEDKKILNMGRIRNQNDIKVISLFKSLLKMNVQEKNKIKKYIEIWEDGVVPKVLTNKVLAILKNTKNMEQIIKEIFSIIPEVYLEYNKDTVSTKNEEKSEVVLSLNGKQV